MAYISIIKLGTITSNIDSTLHFLRENNLIKTGKFCDSCNVWMSHVTDRSRADSYVWRCPSCRQKTQLRADSFWDGQKLPLSIYLSILFLFSNGISAQQASRMLEGEAHFNTVHTWYNLYRDIMSRTLLESPIKLGGPTKIVEIDESKWGHKRKYNRGRINKNSQWILGLIERGTSKVCLLIVRNRSAEELIPLIQGVVLPGTTIMSDQWAAYNSLGTLGYTHYTVNHTENFVDPRTGAHTQTIESFWGQSKSIFKNMRGSTADQLPAHLDEVMFRWNNKEQPMFHLLLQKISQLYPCEDPVGPGHFFPRPPIAYNGANP